VLTFNCIETLIQILKELSVLFPRQERGNQGFLLSFELNEFLKLLLLKLITNKLDILSEVSNLCDLLALSLCQL
jgi:hypothetical protein